MPAAASVLNFFATDPEAARITGVERGVPVLPRSREVILPVLDETERATVEYLNLLQGKTAAYIPWPAGGSEFDNAVLRPVSQLVAFGRLSNADAVRKLVEDGKSVL